jgi:hypothetical protein
LLSIWLIAAMALRRHRGYRHFAPVTNRNPGQPPRILKTHAN